MIDVYELNNQLDDFKELEIHENVPLFEFLGLNKILLFADKHNQKIYIWQGKNTTSKMKFITTQLAPNFRDQHYISYSITTVDEDEETFEFKVMLGLP